MSLRSQPLTTLIANERISAPATSGSARKSASPPAGHFEAAGGTSDRGVSVSNRSNSDLRHPGKQFNSSCCGWI